VFQFLFAWVRFYHLGFQRLLRGRALTNRLSRSTSPYLLQHADNPVDWYSWGAEALAKAAQDDKPIFLSIGYSACHWCHVMAHESFEDPDIADYLNRHFVSVKVDREERPDLDAIYMDAVVAMTGHGGWPMSVFLTPQGEPFFGGTYFPPTPRQGLPSFIQVLEGVNQAWQSQRSKVLTAGTQMVQRIGQSHSFGTSETGLDSGLLDQAAERLFQTYDWTNGGWGGAPKFPSSAVIEFLLQRAAVAGDNLARDMATHALQHMAEGGIFDQIGGGFARYAVDAEWTVPHFEKMLYDNAQLIPAYLHAWQVTGNQELLDVGQRTVDFCVRELRLPEGGFASSLDADSDGEEGKYYTWSNDEIDRVLDDPLARKVFGRAFGLADAPNFEGRYVLRRTTSDEDLAEAFSRPVAEIRGILDQARIRALSAREERSRPALDDKVVAVWNGLTLRALSQFARARGDSSVAGVSRSLAEFLRDHLLDQGRPMRAWRSGIAFQSGFLEDCAALGLGWLAEYEVSFDTQWFDLARAQADLVLSHFSDPSGGFYDTPSDQVDQLVVRPRHIQDNPTPSGSSLAVELLLRLSALTGETERYADPALQCLSAMQNDAVRHPSAFAGWLSALAFAHGPQLQLAFVGFEPEPDYLRLRSTADRLYLPDAVTAGRKAGSADGPALLDGRTAVDQEPTAFLCQGFTCRLPTTEPDELRRQLERARAQ
jgi:uncharacterized protein YyaL (SSP411 family)